MRLVFLDSGPLGLLANARGRPRADHFRLWAKGLAAAGVRRLDRVKSMLEYAPIMTDVMLRAAELWADARRLGRPTASPDALDGDGVLAAQALLAPGPGDVVTVATGNVGHLSRSITAERWDLIVP